MKQQAPRERRVLIKVSPSFLLSSVLPFILKVFVKKPGSEMLVRVRKAGSAWVSSQD